MERYLAMPTFFNRKTVAMTGTFNDLNLFKIVDDTESAFQYLKVQLSKYYL